MDMGISKFGDSGEESVLEGHVLNLSFLYYLLMIDNTRITENLFQESLIFCFEIKPHFKAEYAGLEERIGLNARTGLEY